MVLIATLPHPCQRRILHECIEPCAYKRVPNLQFMIEERKRKLFIHSLYPEGQFGKFNSKRVYIHAIDASLYDMPLQTGFQYGLEVFIP